MLVLLSHNCCRNCPCAQSLADRRGTSVFGWDSGMVRRSGDLSHRAFSCPGLSQGADGFPLLELVRDGEGRTWALLSLNWWCRVSRNLGTITLFGYLFKEVKSNKWQWHILVPFHTIPDFSEVVDAGCLVWQGIASPGFATVQGVLQGNCKILLNILKMKLNIHFILIYICHSFTRCQDRGMTWPTIIGCNPEIQLWIRLRYWWPAFQCVQCLIFILASYEG